MANKKSKGSKPKGPAANSKPKESKPVSKRPASLVNVQGVTQLTPQERIDRVKPYWELQPQDQRIQLLTLTLDSLRERAATLPPDPHSTTLSCQVLEEGILRLRERRTWKIWSWRDKDGGTQEFYDVESFKQFCHERLLADSLEKLLPKHEGKAVEKPAEAAFRERMQALLLKLQNPQGGAAVRRAPEEPMNRHRRQRAAGNDPRAHSSSVRDSNIETITMMLGAFEGEHEFLYNSLLHPITAMVCEVVPDDVRESNTSELYFEDLERMHPDDVARICEWLTEKVDTLSSKLKPESKDEEEAEDNLGDVDLFALANDGMALTVHPKWLQHLSERLLGEDDVPRRRKLGEDPHNIGLVLEWVYGSIVSTAGKAREAAKSSLSRDPPSARQAFQTLQNALQEQETWENRVTQARELLNEMLRSRKEAADLALQYDMQRQTSTGADGLLVDEAQLPSAVMVVMLRREVLLTRAKLSALFHERIMAEKQLRTLQLQFRQGEPEFERLKREMEENRLPPRSGLDSHGRSAADVERHRQQLADSALEEQLELQSAFRETSSRLQGIYDRRHQTEMELQQRETEIKQLQGWRVTVDNVADKFEEQMAMLRGGSGQGDVEEGGQTDPATTSSHCAVEGQPAVPSCAVDGQPAVPRCAVDGQPAVPCFALEKQPATSSSQVKQAEIQLRKLRKHFLNDLRKQLYNDDDDKHFFNWVQSQMKGVEKRLEEGRVALQHLELHLVNVACDDPGSTVATDLALPLLQDRLYARAAEHNAQKAAALEAELIAADEASKAKKLAKKDRQRARKTATVTAGSQASGEHLQPVPTTAASEAHVDEGEGSTGVGQCGGASMEAGAEIGAVDEGDGGARLVGPGRHGPIAPAAPELQSELSGSRSLAVSLAAPQAQLAEESGEQWWPAGQRHSSRAAARAPPQPPAAQQQSPAETSSRDRQAGQRRSGRAAARAPPQPPADQQQSPAEPSGHDRLAGAAHLSSGAPSSSGSTQGTRQLGTGAPFPPPPPPRQGPVSRQSTAGQHLQGDESGWPQTSRRTAQRVASPDPNEAARQPLQGDESEWPQPQTSRRTAQCVASPEADQAASSTAHPPHSGEALVAAPSQRAGATTKPVTASSGDSALPAPLAFIISLSNAAHLAAATALQGTAGASSTQQHTAGASSTQQYRAGASSTQQHMAGASSTQQHMAGASSTQQHMAGASSTQQHTHGASSTQQHTHGASSATPHTHGASSTTPHTHGTSSTTPHRHGASSTPPHTHAASSTPPHTHGASSTPPQHLAHRTADRPLALPALGSSVDDAVQRAGPSVASTVQRAPVLLPEPFNATSDQFSIGEQTASGAACNRGSNVGSSSSSLPAPAPAHSSLPAPAPAHAPVVVSSREQEEEDEPENLCCPITHALMVDPVLAMDGRTYERAHIEEWLSVHDTSPITNTPLPSKLLVPNLALKSVITDHKAKMAARQRRD